MSTTRVTVNIDEEIKRDAQRVLSEIGMDMTTAIDAFLRTIVREERFPFELRTAKAYREAAGREYIHAELEKSMLEAADPDTQWLSQEEMKTRIAKRREERSRV